ncbi:MAG: hypothetical protein JWP57_4619 [Spirosoma sp.]|nr:hypothetical protein [Spirosoma sp.]
MLQSTVVFALLILSASVGLGQTDTARKVQPSPNPVVQIPGIDTPLSGPGTLLQSSPNPNAVAVPQKRGKKGRLKTNPPSDPRAFGVAVPLGDAKKDTLNH